jgi:hypothetical protein
MGLPAGNPAYMEVHRDVLAALRKALHEGQGRTLPEGVRGDDGRVRVYFGDADLRTLEFVRGFLSGYGVGLHEPVPPVEDLQLEQDIQLYEAEAYAAQRIIAAKAQELLNRLENIPAARRDWARARIQTVANKFSYSV